MRLIDADARVTVQSFDEEHEEYDHTEMSVEEALDFFTDEGCPPAVDAAPVVHGEWIDDADPGEIVGEHWMCSNCEMVFGMPEDTMRIHRYCPYCGAKMNAPTCGPDYCEIGGGDD